MSHRSILTLLALAATIGSASAAIVTQNVSYRIGATVMEGQIVYDDAKGKRPCVLIAHDWTGPDDYEKSRAKQIAELGYTAFVVDVYGRDVRPKNQAEYAAASGKLGADRLTVRRRIGAALNFAFRHAYVDSKRIAAIGYCFGGMVVLELARSGSPVRGVVSFHGNLSNPNPKSAGSIRTPVLVLHGADDPFVPPAQVAAFENEMKAASKPYRLIAYPGAVHSFTLKHAGNDPKTGAAYNADADKKSWAELQKFLQSKFK